MKRVIQKHHIIYENLEHKQKEVVVSIYTSIGDKYEIK